jgi:trk system potassium uptake protein TrkA
VIAVYIVVSGGGKVGAFLADQLSSEDHTVVLIEKDEATCQRLAARTRATVICGDACDYHYQDEAHTERADVFAAVTGDDDDNLVACQLARTAFNVRRVVARVNNPKNERIFNRMGVDAISSTTIIGHLIEEEASVGSIMTRQLMKKGNVAIVEVEIPSKGNPMCCNRSIGELGLPSGVVIASILRGDELIVPKGADRLAKGDLVIAVAQAGKEERLKKVLTC